MPEKIRDSQNVTARIGKNFSNELEEIKDKRLENKIDKKRKSTRKLTDLIIKHSGWKRIKEDTIKKNLEGKYEK